MPKNEDLEDPLSVSLFGSIQVATYSGTPIDISNRRGRIILAMLSINPGQALSRDLVSKLIWEGRFKPQARASLRQCLHDLKRELQGSGLDVLEVSNTQLAIKPHLIQTDLQALETALRDGQDTRATQFFLELTGKTLLADLEFGNALNQWLVTQRVQIENRLRMSTQRLLSKLRASGLDEQHDAL